MKIWKISLFVRDSVVSIDELGDVLWSIHIANEFVILSMKFMTHHLALFEIPVDYELLRRLGLLWSGYNEGASVILVWTVRKIFWIWRKCKSCGLFGRKLRAGPRSSTRRSTYKWVWLLLFHLLCGHCGGCYLYVSRSKHYNVACMISFATLTVRSWYSITIDLFFVRWTSDDTLCLLMAYVACDTYRLMNNSYSLWLLALQLFEHLIVQFVVICFNFVKHMIPQWKRGFLLRLTAFWYKYFAPDIVNPRLLPAKYEHCLWKLQT